jgi:hypothetical protein
MRATGLTYPQNVPLAAFVCSAGKRSRIWTIPLPSGPPRNEFLNFERRIQELADRSSNTYQAHIIEGDSLLDAFADDWIGQSAPPASHRTGAEASHPAAEIA